jgi:hypothetical protein
MSWKVWKDPLVRASEEFQKGYLKGLNLSNWNSAASSFNSASELYNGAGDRANGDLARALSLFANALGNPQISECWENAAAAIYHTGLGQINVTSNVPTKDIVEECTLKSLEIKNRSIVDDIAKAGQLEETAKKYLVFGGKSLLIPLLLEKQQLTGLMRAHRLIAEASVLRGDVEILSDPKHAAEFYRKAALHMKTSGDIQYSQQLSGIAEDFATTALCYFCGREVIGKEINFVYMKAQITKFIENQNTAKILPSTSGNMVIACRGCHSAITIAADDIAKAYFDQAQVEINRLQSEIDHLNNRINNLQFRAR